MAVKTVKELITSEARLRSQSNVNMAWQKRLLTCLPEENGTHVPGLFAYCLSVCLSVPSYSPLLLLFSTCCNPVCQRDLAPWKSVLETSWVPGLASRNLPSCNQGSFVPPSLWLAVGLLCASHSTDKARAPCRGRYRS